MLGNFPVITTLMIKQAARNKSSLLLNIILQNTQTLQLFTKLITQKLFTKVIQMPSLKAWVERPTGLIRRGMKRKCYSRECFIGVIIPNQSKSLPDTLSK